MYEKQSQPAKTSPSQPAKTPQPSPPSNTPIEVAQSNPGVMLNNVWRAMEQQNLPKTPPPEFRPGKLKAPQEIIIPIGELTLPENAIARKIAAPAPPPTSGGFEKQLQQERGGGQPLDSSLREKVEPIMGADLSGVRVHTGEPADSMNQQIQAKAFTSGSDVFFRKGMYQPGTKGGQELIAHELTHTVQQGGVVQKKRERNPTALEVQSKPQEGIRISGGADDDVIQRVMYIPYGVAKSALQDMDSNSKTDVNRRAAMVSSDEELRSQSDWAQKNLKNGDRVVIHVTVYRDNTRSSSPLTEKEFAGSQWVSFFHVSVKRIHNDGTDPDVLARMFYQIAENDYHLIPRTDKSYGSSWIKHSFNTHKTQINDIASRYYRKLIHYIGNEKGAITQKEAIKQYRERQSKKNNRSLENNNNNKNTKNVMNSNTQSTESLNNTEEIQDKVAQVMERNAEFRDIIARPIGEFFDKKLMKIIKNDNNNKNKILSSTLSSSSSTNNTNTTSKKQNTSTIKNLKKPTQKSKRKNNHPKKHAPSKTNKSNPKNRGKFKNTNNPKRSSNNLHYTQIVQKTQDTIVSVFKDLAKQFKDFDRKVGNEENLLTLEEYDFCLDRMLEQAVFNLRIPRNGEIPFQYADRIDEKLELEVDSICKYKYSALEHRKNLAQSMDKLMNTKIEKKAEKIFLQLECNQNRLQEKKELLKRKTEGFNASCQNLYNNVIPNQRYPEIQEKKNKVKNNQKQLNVSIKEEIQKCTEFINKMKSKSTDPRLAPKINKAFKERGEDMITEYDTLKTQWSAKFFKYITEIEDLLFDMDEIKILIKKNIKEVKTNKNQQNIKDQKNTSNNEPEEKDNNDKNINDKDIMYVN